MKSKKRSQIRKGKNSTCKYNDHEKNKKHITERTDDLNLSLTEVEQNISNVKEEENVLVLDKSNELNTIACNEKNIGLEEKENIIVNINKNYVSETTDNISSEFKETEKIIPDINFDKLDKEHNNTKDNIIVNNMKNASDKKSGILTTLSSLSNDEHIKDIDEKEIISENDDKKNELNDNNNNNNNNNIEVTYNIDNKDSETLNSENNFVQGNSLPSPITNENHQDVNSNVNKRKIKKLVEKNPDETNTRKLRKKSVKKNKNDIIYPLNGEIVEQIDCVKKEITNENLELKNEVSFENNEMIVSGIQDENVKNSDFIKNEYNKETKVITESNNELENKKISYNETNLSENDALIVMSEKSLNPYVNNDLENSTGSPMNSFSQSNINTENTLMSNNDIINKVVQEGDVLMDEQESSQLNCANVMNVTSKVIRRRRIRSKKKSVDKDIKGSNEILLLENIENNNAINISGNDRRSTNLYIEGAQANITTTELIQENALAVTFTSERKRRGRKKKDPNNFDFLIEPLSKEKRNSVVVEKRIIPRNNEPRRIRKHDTRGKELYDNMDEHDLNLVHKLSERKSRRSNIVNHLLPFRRSRNFYDTESSDNDNEDRRRHKRRHMNSFERSERVRNNFRRKHLGKEAFLENVDRRLFPNEDFMVKEEFMDNVNSLNTVFNFNHEFLKFLRKVSRFEDINYDAMLKFLGDIQIKLSRSIRDEFPPEFFETHHANESFYAMSHIVDILNNNNEILTKLNQLEYKFYYDYLKNKSIENIYNSNSNSNDKFVNNNKHESVNWNISARDITNESSYRSGQYHNAEEEGGEIFEISRNECNIPSNNSNNEFKDSEDININESRRTGGKDTLANDMKQECDIYVNNDTSHNNNNNNNNYVGDSSSSRTIRHRINRTENTGATNINKTNDQCVDGNDKDNENDDISRRIMELEKEKNHGTLRDDVQNVDATHKLSMQNRINFVCDELNHLIKKTLKSEVETDGSNAFGRRYENISERTLYKDYVSTNLYRTKIVKDDEYTNEGIQGKKVEEDNGKRRRRRRRRRKGEGNNENIVFSLNNNDTKNMEGIMLDKYSDYFRKLNEISPNRIENERNHDNNNREESSCSSSDESSNYNFVCTKRKNENNNNLNKKDISENKEYENNKDKLNLTFECINEVHNEKEENADKNEPNNLSKLKFNNKEDEEFKINKENANMNLDNVLKNDNMKEKNENHNNDENKDNISSDMMECCKVKEEKIDTKNGNNTYFTNNETRKDILEVHELNHKEKDFVNQPNCTLQDIILDNTKNNNENYNLEKGDGVIDDEHAGTTDKEEEDNENITHGDSVLNDNDVVNMNNNTTESERNRRSTHINNNDSLVRIECAHSLRYPTEHQEFHSTQEDFWKTKEFKKNYTDCYNLNIDCNAAIENMTRYEREQTISNLLKDTFNLKDEDYSNLNMDKTQKEILNCLRMISRIKKIFFDECSKMINNQISVLERNYRIPDCSLTLLKNTFGYNENEN
ncbi:hypothetical protein PFBG_05572 [Plasmodium falciparum 7G8]|uniref:Uncharacterized protein n=1 Tax=Plasmodium falciparum (isolate 7G8) TaxID=57266 RepID=W7F526_PLAF8|nr:hypothetical protein PFBG_05572 [Plasmodium falciparum 7G8]